ncbi:MAG: hypothetical protein HYS13_12925 [Planctomycetia bacterium]|nr:hypothetical protein [Planctomycetia bacterium]
MSVIRLLPVVLLLAAPLGVLAQEQKKTDETKPAETKAAEAKAQEQPAQPAPAASTEDEGVIRMHLMEGSLVTGKLSVGEITVETDFGTLKIPVSSIVSFTPGLDSHPEQRKSIGRLILQLGANNVKDRDAAQKALTDMGRSIKAELERFTSDDDPERKKRVNEILQAFEEQDADASEEDHEAILIPQDSVTTPLFTVVGKISPQKFEMQTQFGSLEVALGDIRRADRETAAKPETRKSVDVTGNHLAGVNYMNTSVKVGRGDVIQITAEGSITMSPWGNNVQSTPEGSPQWQWYIQGKIPGGALCGRIGTSGEEFKVGSKLTMTAKKSGVLYLGFAMNAQFANQGYQFPGQYNVKIKVNAGK